MRLRLVGPGQELHQQKDQRMHRLLVLLTLVENAVHDEYLVRLFVRHLLLELIVVRTERGRKVLKLLRQIRSAAAGARHFARLPPQDRRDRLLQQCRLIVELLRVGLHRRLLLVDLLIAVLLGGGGRGRAGVEVLRVVQCHLGTFQLLLVGLTVHIAVDDRWKKRKTQCQFNRTIRLSKFLKGKCNISNVNSLL